MAKEPKKTEPKPEAAQAAPAPAPAKPIVPVEPTNLGSLALRPYNAGSVAEFGNNFMAALVAAAGAEEEAQKLLNAAGEAKQYLSFEMTRAIFDLSSKNEKVDVYKVYGDAKDVEKLNTRVLLAMGVLRQEVDDDKVTYVWTDTNVEKLYSYTKKLKEEDAAEYEIRFNNRKRLNMRLNEAYRAAVTLKDQGLQPEDLFYSEDSETGAMVPTIRNAPKRIGGDVGTVQMNTRKAVKGADLSPTMSSLVKLANDKHKAPKGDRNDKGENREGEAKLGMTDETFGRIVNTLRQAVTTQEGQFTEDMIKQIKSLYTFLAPIATAS